MEIDYCRGCDEVRAHPDYDRDMNDPPCPNHRWERIQVEDVAVSEGLTKVIVARNKTIARYERELNGMR